MSGIIKPKSSWGGGGSGPVVVANAVGSVRLAVGLATVNSTFILPAGAYVVEVRTVVNVAYAAGTTLAVGQPTAPTAFQTTAENNPQAINRYITYPEAGTVLGVVRVTVGGVVPLVGSATVWVFYTTPLT